MAANSGFTQLTDEKGKTLPLCSGFVTLDDGTFTTRYVILGVCEARDGNLYILGVQAGFEIWECSGGAGRSVVSITVN